MNLPVKLRSVFINFAALAVGVGMAAAWHMSREKTAPPQTKVVDASERVRTEPKTEESRGPISATEPEVPTTSTQAPRALEAPATAGLLTIESPKFAPGSPGFAAEQRRNRRLDALELTFLLGLSTGQSKELEAVLLRELESAPLARRDELIFDGAKIQWLEENLTAQQAKTYNRNTLAKVNEPYESAALESVHKMARVLDLTPEQRFDLFAAETRRNMMLSSGAGVALVIPKETAEASAPVSGLSEVTILPPVREVGEILTPEQWSR
ncbi:MAG: hypothetical protein ACKO2G_14640 [Verrucomicrobiales bacterium]